MAKVRIPFIISGDVESIAGGSITQTGFKAINAITASYPTGQKYSTQRPSTNTIEVTADIINKTHGRGIYYWTKNNTLYIVNDDSVYIDTYFSTPLSIDAGTDRVYFVALGNYLMIVDPENNKGWLLDSANNLLAMAPGTSGTWADSSGTPIYDFAGFPADLADGAEVLDQTAYVLTSAATIHGSDLNDLLNWDALNVLTAEKEDDGGLALSKHHDNLVVFGRRTIEFMYDAANPTGSPLLPRNDISYNTGIMDGKSFYRESDILYFMGLTSTGQASAYKIDQFQLSNVTSPTYTSLFTTSVVVDNAEILGSGCSSGGNSFYIITIYTKQTGTNDIQSTITAIYNATTNEWGEWEHASSAINNFPLAGWTLATDTLNNSAGRGIFSNGDYFSLFDDFNPQDSIAATTYVVSGYVDDLYISDTVASGDNIIMTIRIGNIDFGVRHSKRMTELRFIGDEADTQQDLLLQWSDEKDHNFNAGRNLRLDKAGWKLSRIGGPFRSRSFQVVYSGDEQIRLEALEVEVIEDLQ